ncbi:Cuticular protein 67B [Carabus blaptoides fortunei]
MKLFVIIGAALIASVFAEEVRLDDLPPNEAQQILDQQDLSLKYAPKVDSNVPALRFLGNQQHEVLEDIYQARQFHGQDGLGGYVYGYSAPDIAKAEKKKATGDLKGSYSYVNGDGQEIKVEYWDEGTGFHHVDNIPKVVLKPAEDTAEVKAAKEEHFRIWHEQAERNKNYNPNQYEASNYNEQQQQYNNDDSARYNQPQPQPQQQGYQRRPEEEEPVSDPRGFFYSYDYPVGIIVEKGRAIGGVAPQQKREADLFNELYNKNRALLNNEHRQKRAIRAVPEYRRPYPVYFY